MNTKNITHKVIDRDTGKVICTLPISGGGRMPTYRVVVVPVETWKNTNS